MGYFVASDNYAYAINHLTQNIDMLVVNLLMLPDLLFDFWTMDRNFVVCSLFLQMFRNSHSHP